MKKNQRGTAKFSPSRLASGGSKGGGCKRGGVNSLLMRDNFAERGNLTYQDFNGCRNSSGIQAHANTELQKFSRGLSLP